MSSNGATPAASPESRSDTALHEAITGRVRERILERADEITRVLTSPLPSPVCVLDGVLGLDYCQAMRQEAKALQEGGELTVEPSSGEARATQIDFELKDRTPYLFHYALAVVESLALVVNRAVPEAQLSGSAHTNKLAVVERDGARYKKHIDNGGPGDPRKLTVLYYLNPSYSADQAGEFVAFDTEGRIGDETKIAPRGDRLVVFWSDDLVHEVAPSHISSDADHRFALTCWMVTEDKECIRERDAEVLARHFADFAEFPEEMQSEKVPLKVAIARGLARLFAPRI